MSWLLFELLIRILPIKEEKLWRKKDPKSRKTPSERERILSKKALKLVMQGSKLSRELREEDIAVTKVEILVPTAILEQKISDFVAAGADWFDQDDSGDTDTDWPGT